MSWRGTPGLDLINRTQKFQHRGRCGVGIEILIWYEERMGCQLYQKGGRVHVGRPWGTSWSESLFSYCTNDGGIDLGHIVFSWRASMHLLGKPGHQLEVLLQWTHFLEEWRRRMSSCSHLVIGCVCILLLYLSGDVGSYILKLERSVRTFDIGGLQKSPKL